MEGGRKHKCQHQKPGSRGSALRAAALGSLGRVSLTLSFLICKTGLTALRSAEAPRISRGHKLLLPPYIGRSAVKFSSLLTRLPLRASTWERQRTTLLFPLIYSGNTAQRKEKATRLLVGTAEELSNSLYLRIFFFLNYLSRNVWYNERASNTGKKCSNKTFLQQVLSSPGVQVVI